MMTDIVEKLKKNTVCMGHGSYDVEPLSLEASNEIENLRILLAEAHAALSWCILDGMDECIPETCPKEYKFVCDAAGSIAAVIEKIQND